jgi:hypothetical protein
MPTTPTTPTDPRVKALDDAYALAREWQEGEAVIAYAILADATSAFLAGESADAIRNAAIAQPGVDWETP